MIRRGAVIALVVFVAAISGLVILSRYWGGGSITEPTFVERCLGDGNMWHSMKPLRQGIQVEGEEALGCMTADGANHFSDYGEYKAANDPGESRLSIAETAYEAGKPSYLSFSAMTPDGGVPELYREHERYLHVIVVSKDMTVFSHIHPDDQSGFSLDDVRRGELSVPYVFPKAGEYLVAVDYANKLKHESRQFRVSVSGAPQQAEQAATASSPATFAGTTVKFNIARPFAGQASVLSFAFTENGRDVMDLTPYLGAAMHIAIVKNDFSEFIHTHGEWHPPGYVAPQQPSLSHVHAPPPATFGPVVEAHAVFPTPGLYTVFGEFRRNNVVVPTRFTVHVE